MKLSLRIPGVGSKITNLFLLSIIGISFYGALQTFSAPLIAHKSAGREYTWDAQYRDEGGVTQAMMYADREECDNEDNNDNGIIQLCNACNGAGRTLTGAAGTSLAALSVASLLGMLRFSGLDTSMRPDTAMGPGLIAYEMTAHCAAFATMVFGTFMWGTQCMALIDNMERGGLTYPGFTMACASAVMMGLSAVMVMSIKNRPNLWRFRQAGSSKHAVAGKSPSQANMMSPAAHSSSSVHLDVAAGSTSPPASTSTSYGGPPPARTTGGPPPPRSTGRAPPARRGPPPGPGPTSNKPSWATTS